jgi:hypothetical protein
MWLLMFGLFLGAHLASAQTEPRPQHIEMHVIGLYEASGRSLGTRQQDIVDWPRLCAQLTLRGEAGLPGPGQRLWMFLSEEMQAVVRNPGLVKQFATSREDSVQAAKSRLGRALEELLQRPGLFDEQSVQGLELSDAVKTLWEQRQSLSILKQRWLNRLLLQTAFPEEIKKISEVDMPEKVTVQVSLAQRPMILVLSAFESVQWHVMAVPEAQIQQIIIGGFHVQEVTGTAVPVLFQTYEGPPLSGGGRNYFYAYKQDDKRYAEMVDKLRQLTGLEITTFQGQYHYNGRPFVIGPRNP